MSIFQFSDFDEGSSFIPLLDKEFDLLDIPASYRDEDVTQEVLLCTDKTWHESHEEELEEVL